MGAISRVYGRLLSGITATVLERHDQTPLFPGPEKFVVSLYDSKMSTPSVNEDRMMMFRNISRPLNRLLQRR